MARKMDPATGYNFTPTLHNDTYPFVSPQNLDLSGKYVLITGASRGVGKAMAISYAQAGASGIALLARSPLSNVKEEILSAARSSNRPAPQILTIKCDTTSQPDIESAVTEVTNSFSSRLDILINNAGYLETFTPIAESDPTEWWKTFEVNVKGVYLMTRAFLPLVLNTPSGLKTIIQITSIGAHITQPGASAYETTKLTILRFNNFLHAEYVDRGLLTYSVHPGAVMTELSSNMPKESHAILNDSAELCGDVVVWLTGERREWLADRYVSVTWDMQELLDKEGEVVERDLLRVKMRV